MLREKFVNEKGEDKITLTITNDEFIENSKDIIRQLGNDYVCLLGSQVLHQLYAKLFYDKTKYEIQAIIKDKNNIIYDNKLGIIYGEIGETTDLILNGEQLMVGDLVEYSEILTKKEIKKGKKPRVDVSIVCKDVEENKYFIFGARKRCFEHIGDLATLFAKTSIKKIKSYLEITSETQIYDKRISVKKEEK